jgi:NADPH-dependent 2,4-dienoyl-CoA reductase/sulfur reductase-like enzyme
MKTSKRIIIVGVVAGGASCASRCRRLDEDATITVIDRGPYVSFANCGLPYFVGDVIKDDAKLLVANAALFRDRFNIEVRTQNEVTAIDRTSREIEVKELETGRVYREPYDALVLAPGVTLHEIRRLWRIRLGLLHLIGRLRTGIVLN